MYIPTITNTIPSNTIVTASHINSVISATKCLYNREFKPIYVEKPTDCSCIRKYHARTNTRWSLEELKNCPCLACYGDAIWKFIIEKSSDLNRMLIWNDIIKRWEPEKFNQDFTEDVGVISNYEFRKYASVFFTSVDCSPEIRTCEGFIPFREFTEGDGFKKAFKGIEYY